MKGTTALLASAAILGGCQQSSPGGASGGSSTGQVTTETASVERTKSMRAEKSSRMSVQTTASAVIFQVLATRVPRGIDESMAEEGASALRGPARDRVLMAMAIAARPVMGWPLDPLNNSIAAKRWAATVTAAVEIASIAASSIARAIPADGTDNAKDLTATVLKAFQELPHDELAKMLDSLSEKDVVLDLAETSAVKVGLEDGGSLALASDGATLTRAGAIRFSFSGGVLAGSSYSVALDQSTVAALGRTRAMTSNDEFTGSTTVGATAGVR